MPSGGLRTLRPAVSALDPHPAPATSLQVPHSKRLMLFSGRAMSAEEGLAWGFFSRVVEDVHGEAHALAASLAAGPTLAHAMTKRQLDIEWAVSIDTAIEMEAQAQAICMATGDFTRAYDAFAAKRAPAAPAVS